MEKPPEPSGSKLPYEAALLEVIKGLHKEPVLLFGIGAGILVVAVLLFTSSVAIVLIVALLFIAVLAAYVLQRARRISRGTDVTGLAIGGSVKRSRVGTASAGTKGRVRGFSLFSKVTDSSIGTSGGDEPRRPPEG